MGDVISGVFPAAKYFVYEDKSKGNIGYQRFWLEKEFRQLIEGVWCLFCDVDEFLILDQHSSLKRLLGCLSGKPVSALMLNWGVLSCDLDTNSNGEAFSGRHATYGKSLVRRDCINDFVNDHQVSLTSGFYMSGCILNAGIVHVWGRSVKDSILKVCMQEAFQGRFRAKVDSHTLGKTDSALPTRLKVHAFMAKFFKESPFPGISCCDEELEKELISEVLSRVDAEMVEQKYFAYKYSLDNRLANYCLGMDLRIDSGPTIRALADLLP